MAQRPRGLRHPDVRAEDDVALRCSAAGRTIASGGIPGVLAENGAVMWLNRGPEQTDLLA